MWDTHRFLQKDDIFQKSALQLPKRWTTEDGMMFWLFSMMYLNNRPAAHTSIALQVIWRLGSLLLDDDKRLPTHATGNRFPLHSNPLQLVAAIRADGNSLGCRPCSCSKDEIARVVINPT